MLSPAAAATPLLVVEGLALSTEVPVDVKLVGVPLPVDVRPVIVVELMGPPGFVLVVAGSVVGMLVRPLVVTLAVRDESLEEMSDDMGRLVVNESVATVVSLPV